MGNGVINVMVDGKEVQLPEGSEVEELKKQANVPPNRKLFKQGEKGFENVPGKEKVQPGERFGTIPEYTLG